MDAILKIGDEIEAIVNRINIHISEGNINKKDVATFFKKIVDYYDKNNEKPTSMADKILENHTGLMCQLIIEEQSPKSLANCYVACAIDVCNRFYTGKKNTKEVLYELIDEVFSKLENYQETTED